jgi:hypothetical protein
VTQEEDWHSATINSLGVGEVGIVVNNAGYFPNRPSEELDLPTWRKTMVIISIRISGVRNTFLPNDEKEELGSLCRHIVRHGWVNVSRHEPLHRFKDGNRRVHARAGERRCERRNYCERGVTRAGFIHKLPLLAAEPYNILAFHLTLAPATIAPVLVASVLWVLVFLQYRGSFKDVLAAKPALGKP